eukprot:TRINITY_DN778_c0_g1_i1.p1 TRINITY_DN778_c0_g1~~TRINITY_DN778_c0_g1_i1.p1  ORF type:complete len:268 (-),score=65.26 TRINITY_DN778_c0_g1_i1:615-1418(-)
MPKNKGENFGLALADRRPATLSYAKQVLSRVMFAPAYTPISLSDRVTLELAELIQYVPDSHYERAFRYYDKMRAAYPVLRPPPVAKPLTALSAAPRVEVRREAVPVSAGLQTYRSTTTSLLGRLEAMEARLMTVMGDFLVVDRSYGLWEDATTPLRRGLPGRDSPWALEAMQFRELTPEDYELLCKLDDTVEKKTVPASAIDAFPTRVFDSTCAAADSCRVCMVDYEDGDALRTLPCGHSFHADCIRTWLAGSSVNCPIDGLPVVSE